MPLQQEEIKPAWTGMRLLLFRSAGVTKVLKSRLMDASGGQQMHWTAPLSVIDSQFGK